METIIEEHGEYGPIQIMETAVAYYQLDDEKVPYYHLVSLCTSKKITITNSVLSSENETERFDSFKESLR